MTKKPEHVVSECRKAFKKAFGHKEEVAGCAPGRVNIIGEHTDYTGGFAMPAAIPMYTAVAVRRNGTGFTNIVSSALGKKTIPARGFSPDKGFHDFVAGAIRQCGLEGTGLDVMIHSNLPLRAGLSSSASLTVATVAALLELAAKPWDPMSAARAAKAVENDYVGVPCGFMDQFAVACGKPGKALLLDCWDNTFEEVLTTIPGYQWAAVYTGIDRELAGGDYGDRVAAVHHALAVIEELIGLNPAFLRWYGMLDTAHLCCSAHLEREYSCLLQHVAAENKRVFAMKRALEKQDRYGVACVLESGHRSLSSLFGVSTELLDDFVVFAREQAGMGGMRLTGAGFGGSFVALLQRGNRNLRRKLLRVLREHVSRSAAIYVFDDFAGGVTTWRQ